VRRRLLQPLAVTTALLAASAACTVRAAEATCEGVCPAPVLAEPEPALQRAVHLTWSEFNPQAARMYEIQRRVREVPDGWQVVRQIAAGSPLHHDDAGPKGKGLVPGEYEYRVRGLYQVGSYEAWSAWSPPEAVQIREACVEAEGEIAGLARVVADDRNGDGRYTGDDLVLALRQCAALGGCTLEALPVTYDDVAIVVSNGDPVACSRERTACLTDPFPNGLAIEGHGRSTVLRSPLWDSPYLPQPLLEVWRRPELRIQLRHLVLDGRKTEQGDPLPGQNNANGWRHFGFQVWNQWHEHDRRNREGCVHDVLVRDFMTRGISLADVARWSVEYSVIKDIGCARSLTPCPRLTIPDAFGPGYTSTGLGIHVDWHSDDVVIRANRVRRAAKYSISLKHGQDAKETSIRRPRVVDNDVAKTQLGIFVGGVADGLFEGNRIAATDSLNPQPEARNWNDTFGISCNGALERTGFQGNRIEDSGGMAISWSCAGSGNYVAATHITGSCSLKGPESCVPGPPRSCYLNPDVWVVASAAGTLALLDNLVAESGCAAPLAVDLGTPGFELLIRGGRYTAGNNAVRPVGFTGVDVLIEGAARFEGTALAFGPASRGIVAPMVSVTRTPDRFLIDRGAQVLACPDRPRDCEEICSRSEPPSWCRVPDVAPGGS
jgi:hypothetical protein